jgi:pimeloyl-ACP methyl ester carboxylesterase
VKRVHFLTTGVVCAALGSAVLLAVPAVAVPTGLTWTSCHGDAECAELPVPLDDAVTGGPMMDLALVRYRARHRSERIGSLLLNPGGPGASGVDFVVGAVDALPDEVRNRFDIVGFDPRGVARSHGVDCTDDLDQYYALDFSPQTDAEFDTLRAGVQQLVSACIRKDGAILPYLSTPRAARDLDRIRAALGDDSLTYVGYSYGTYLGAWYAEQFPDRVRALVLDGPLDPALDAAKVQVQQAEGFERELRSFFAMCARDSSCAFHRAGDPAAAYDRLRAGVERRPVPAGKGRTLSGTQFDVAVVELLYQGRSAWGELAASLDAAAEGDGSDLLSDFDTYTGRKDDGRYDGSEQAFLAVSCSDSPPVGDVATFRAIEERAAVVAPRLGPWIVNNSLACALWPVPGARPRALHASGAPPIVVIGGTKDPATPFAWAKGLARELDSGVLVTVRGTRHTSFAAGNACVDRVVTRYVVDRAAPTAGTRC